MLFLCIYSGKDNTTMRATLHINAVEEDDYNTQYVCWMENAIAPSTYNPTLTFRLPSKGARYYKKGLMT
jgi:hypothetical protein